MMPKSHEFTHKYLERRAQAASSRACRKMELGSREYDEIRRLVDEYIANQHAADIVSGQIELDL